MKNISQQEIIEKLLEKDDNFDLSHYTPLNYASQDAFIIYQDETAGTKYYQGKIWSQKIIHEQGMSELLLMQERKSDGKFGKWTPFIYRSSDPNISASSVFDRVQRTQVDEGARNRINRFVNIILTLVIVILMYIIAFDVVIYATFQFFLMLTGFAIAIALTFYYERRNIKNDMVDHATIYPEAPNISISRSFIHPVSHDVKRFSAEVTPIFIQSSKTPISKTRGYTVAQMSDHVKYNKSIEKLKRAVYAFTLKYENIDENDKEMKENEQADLRDIAEFKNEILKSHSQLISTSELNTMINDAQTNLSNEVFKNKVIDELEYHKLEFDQVHTKLSQTEVERDKYAKDAQSWMRKSNNDLNNSEVLLASRLARELQNSTIVDNYQPAELPNVKQRVGLNMNSNVSALIFAVIAFAVTGFVFTLIYNSIQTALANLGGFGNFFFILVMLVVALAVAYFIFIFSKSRVSDKMRNNSQAQKVVQR
ncbi:MAG: hypothetical protein INQ03_13750 [Candidatus Heimdallarchaeota archaeon]|nr:hypothetical protein [Candidatus Heimdallarchaeota archaeon]